MTGQPPVSSEAVISILRIRLNEEIYQRAMLEAAYNQATQQVKTLTEQLAHTQHQLAETQAEPEHDSSLGLRGNPVTPHQTETRLHEFTPGENPLRCQHCGYLKDAARHAHTGQKVKPKN